MHLRRCSRLLLTLSLIVLIIGCEAGDGTTKPRGLDEDVGARIDLDVAQRWVERARGGTTDDDAAHRVSASRLAAVSNAAPDRVGLAFHHGLDEQGTHRLLLTAMHGDGEPWRSSLVIDMSTDAPIDRDVARAWADRHAQTNPGATRYHFYGRDMFDEIMSGPGFDHLEVMSAIDDDGQPQLVLMAWGGGDATTGFRSAEPGSYDSGLACPPVCSGTD